MASSHAFVQNDRHITQPFIVVGCVVSNEEGKILLLHEDGKWNLPAGWLELEEKLADGAQREAEEETGQETVIDELLGVYTLIKHRSEKTLHAVKFIFRAHFTGRTTETNEKISFQWFTPDEIRDLGGNFWDADVPKIVEDWEKGVSVELQNLQAYTRGE